MNFQQTMILGRLVRDPELKYLPNQTAVCEFAVAASRKWRTAGGEDREETLFLDCCCFAKRGEAIAQYFQKGKPIFAVGYLRQENWEDKQTGQKRSKLKLVVDDFQFVGDRVGDGDGNEGAGGGDRKGRQFRSPKQRLFPAKGTSGAAPSQAPEREQPFGDEQQFKEDDIPFRWAGRIGQPL